MHILLVTAAPNGRINVKALLSHSITHTPVVSVDFTAPQFSAVEGEGEVVVCVQTDLATATPLTLSVVAMETSPPVATGN